MKKSKQVGGKKRLILASETIRALSDKQLSERHLARVAGGRNCSEADSGCG
jgi:hypothetical protein